MVKSGDSLSKIAKTYYGNANEYKRIAEANNIPDPDKIKAGQQLKIPGIEPKQHQGRVGMASSRSLSFTASLVLLSFSEHTALAIGLSAPHIRNLFKNNLTSTAGCTFAN